MSNPRSTARLGDHPIHTMLVPFPIACFTLAFASDIAFFRTGNVFWSTASLWLLGIGLIMASFAAIAGIADATGHDSVRRLSETWLHSGGNTVVVIAEVFNWYLRYARGSDAIVFTGLILSGISVVFLLFAAWMGGELVYRRHVGVVDF